MFTITSCNTTEKLVKSRIREEFTIQPLQTEVLLTDNDIAHLPNTVKKYLFYTGAVGKSKIQNMCIEFNALMYRKPNDSPMKSESKQYNFYTNYTRIFLMKASKMLIPFRAKHIYSNQQANFVVRVAGLFNAVDINGEELTKAETVTVLNDLCLFAPACLIDKRLTWKEIDSLTSEVTFTNGKYKVSAFLYFNEKGELVNFISDDRSAMQDDGTLKTARWSTPVSDYKEFNGRKVPTYGETIWHYPEGNFTYGKFTLKSIQYNISN